ncbi:MAG: ubiquinone biosynthesis protein UbiE [Lachnospiraceae bacterium]|nr:ubiquinone biosynthesis protein UbiE [Lachnospiraceae bacterium]
MTEIVEEFFSGYCKTHNESRMITCEYRVENGYYSLESVDCDFMDCPHSAACTVVRQALEKEEEEP